MATFSIDLISGNQLILTGDFTPSSLTSITGATNGLNTVGRKIGLGGIIGNNTNINLNNYDLNFSGGTLKYNIHPIFNDSLEIIDKQYVDDIASGLRPKAAVMVATTGNTTLSGLTIIDGIQTVIGMRILVKDQLSGEYNGIYSATTGNWGRTSDFDGNPSGEVTAGSYMWVLSGNTNSNTSWILDTPDPIIIDVDPLNFVLFSHVKDVVAGTGITVNSLNGVHIVSLNNNSQNVVNNAITGNTNLGTGTTLSSKSSRNITLKSISAVGGLKVLTGDNNNLILSGGTSIANWDKIINKPSWLSGTTLNNFQLSHSHSRYANLSGATFSGVINVPKPAQSDNTTCAASTSWYISQGSTASPLMDGIATGGTSNLFSRQDHKHPIDTSRLAVSAFNTYSGTTVPNTYASLTLVNKKAFLSGATFSGVIDANVGLKISGTTITATPTELNYVKGVTSAIQTQLNGKNIVQVSGVTLIQSGWTLNVGTNFYEYSYTNANITSTKFIMVVPDNNSAFIVSAANVLPF